MREALLARQSELPPEINEHNFAALIADRFLEPLVLDDLEVHTWLLLGPNAAMGHQGQKDHTSESNEFSHAGMIMAKVKER
jgi:hypothetical protein